MRVLFYEPTHTGHHFPYLARMLPGFLRLPIHPILATTPEALASNEYATTLAPLADRIEIAAICETMTYRSSFHSGLDRYRQLRRAIRRTRPDHVCILYGHGIWELWATAISVGRRLAPRGVSVEMWEYRGGFAYPDATGAGNWLKRRLLARLLRSGQLDVMHIDDELLFGYAKSVCSVPERVRLTPNPIKFRDMIDKSLARQSLSIEMGGRLTSCSGMVDRRKGCDLAVKAFARHLESTGDAGAEDRLLLAGPHDAQIQQLLEEPDYKRLVESGRIVSLDRFLNEDEMFLVAAASDVVLAPYPNHSGRSSIILWAAAAGRPVLGVARGCIQHVIEQEHLGDTCGVVDLEDFSAALTKSFDREWTQDDVQRVRAYAAWHRIENYQDLSSQFVRERCGESTVKTTAVSGEG